MEKNLELKDVRKVLAKIIPAEELACMSDEELRRASLTADLGFTSLDFVEFTLDLELATRISIPDREEFETVQELLDICNT